MNILHFDKHTQSIVIPYKTGATDLDFLPDDNND